MIHSATLKEAAVDTLELVVRRAGEKTSIIELAGEVDIFTSQPFQSAINDLIKSGTHHVVIDLSHVHYMDSAGLGVLVAALKRLNLNEGTLSVVGPTTPVREVFRKTRLDRILRIYGNPREALDSIAGP
jgi:anti-sigma B factor antagonist